MYKQRNISSPYHVTCISVMGGAWATPVGHVSIHRLLHRLGFRIGNHYQLSFGAIQWVTDMPI